MRYIDKIDSINNVFVQQLWDCHNFQSENDTSRIGYEGARKDWKEVCNILRAITWARCAEWSETNKRFVEGAFDCYDMVTSEDFIRNGV